MSEQYKELFENELLNEETKQQLQEAFETKLEEQKQEIRNQLESEYAEKFVEQKQQLANQLNTTMQESIDQEIQNLKEDIEYYKTLDVHYAKKLNEFKEEYKEKMAENWKSFLESQVKEGFQELQSDLQRAKENEIGRRIFEAFKDEFMLVENMKEGGAQLKEELDSTKSELETIREENEKLKRDQLLESLLSNLTGTKREVMSTILENVPHDRLEQRYEEALPKVMNEDNSDSESDNGDDSTLTESNKDQGTHVESSDYKTDSEMNRYMKFINRK